MTKNIFEKELLKPSIFKDRNALSPHFIPKSLPFRESEIDKVMKILAPALKGKRPNNLLIYGKTGTGKTCVTKHVLEEFDAIKGKYKICSDYMYINCRIHNSKYQVLLKSVELLKKSQKFLGYSASLLYDKMLEHIENWNKTFIIVLDEVDLVKDIDDLIYALTRANDDLQKGCISLIGISNSVDFKNRLGSRSKSSLCEQELVFAPYNADQLKEILKQRAGLGFRKNVVSAPAISLAAAYAAQEAGDARYALKLLERAGAIADAEGSKSIEEEHVKKARKAVEEDIVYELIKTLPEQQQIVLYAIACLDLEGSKYEKLIKEAGEEHVLFSGEVYENYEKISKKVFGKEPRSARWFRQYIDDLEMLGLITTTFSGKGIRGNTRLIKIAYPAQNVKLAIDKKFGE